MSWIFGLLLWFFAREVFAQDEWVKGKLQSLIHSDPGGIRNIKPAGNKIGQGLKEALQVGITKAVAKTGQIDGFYGNDTIRILMPDKLKTLDKALRGLGYGPKLDQFVLSLNRAAEAAAPAAQRIFVEAIFHLSFEDAEQIYNGGNRAATEYLKKTNYNKLRKAFQPIVKKALQEFDVTQKYQEILDYYDEVPFPMDVPPLDINEYVIVKTLSGLFYVLGQEEHRIRTEPQARVTNLLKEVFK